MNTKMDLSKIKLKKCCFCVPLSKGFLALGYVNLVYHALLFAMILFIGFIALIFGIADISALEICILLPFVLICINFYSLLVVIAAHLKKLNMLRVLLKTGTVLWIFEILYSPCLGSRMLTMKFTQHADRVHLALCLIPVILEPFLQGYVLLLVYSTISKLKEEDRNVGHVYYKNKVENGDAWQTTNPEQCLIK